MWFFKLLLQDFEKSAAGPPAVQGSLFIVQLSPLFSSPSYFLETEKTTQNIVLNIIYLYLRTIV